MAKYKHLTLQDRQIIESSLDSIMVSKSTLYRLVDYCLFDARNMDLPRKVRFAQRKKNKTYKVDKSCRIGSAMIPSPS